MSWTQLYNNYKKSKEKEREGKINVAGRWVSEKNADLYRNALGLAKAEKIKAVNANRGSTKIARTIRGLPQATPQATRNIIGFGKEAIGGGTSRAADMYGQRYIDREIEKASLQNNRMINIYSAKLKNSKTKKDKEKYRKAIDGHRRLNVDLAKEVGGELKDKTNLQLAGTALETATELGTLGGAGLLKGGAKFGAKAVGRFAPKTTTKATEFASKELVKSAAKKGAVREVVTSAPGIGAQLGATVSASSVVQNKDATYGDLVMGTAIGVGAGVGLPLIFKVASKAADRQAKTVFDEAKAKLKDGEDISVYVKDVATKKYIQSAKTPEEKLDILLKNSTVLDIENGLTTPLPKKEKAFIIGEVQKEIDKSGLEDTAKNIAKIQESIVKRLDETTTQTRMLREAAQEARESGDEVLQKKVMQSYAYHEAQFNKAKQGSQTSRGRKKQKKIANKSLQKMEEIKTKEITRKEQLVANKITKLELQKQKIVKNSTTKKLTRKEKGNIKRIDTKITKLQTAKNKIRASVEKKYKTKQPPVEKTSPSRKTMRKQQKKKSKVTREASTTKGIKNTIRENTGQVNVDKKVITTEKKLLLKKFREEVKNRKAGAKFGREEQRVWFNRVLEFAKQNGVSEKIMKQKGVANIKTEKQLLTLLDRVEELGRKQTIINVEAKKLKEMNKEISDISKSLKKSKSRGGEGGYAVDEETYSIITGLRKAANDTKDPVLKRNAIEKYRIVATTMEEAIDKTAKIGSVRRTVARKIGDKETNKLLDRLGIPTKKDALMAHLYGNANYTKELEAFEKIANTFEQGDKLVPDNVGFALEAVGYKNASLKPTSKLIKDYPEIAELKGSKLFNAMAKSDISTITPYYMKEKVKVVSRLVGKTQALEAKMNANMYTKGSRIKELEKAFKKGTKKSDREASNVRIQKLVEGKSKDIEATELEKNIAKEFDQYLDTVATYLEKTDDKFKRVDGYFPRDYKQEEELTNLIKEHGIAGGVGKLAERISNKAGLDANSISRSLHNVMRSDSASFLKHRTVKDARFSDNAFDTMRHYLVSAEQLKFIRETNPYMGAMKFLGEEIEKGSMTLKTWAEVMEKQVKGKDAGEITKRLLSVFYIAKLGASVPSAAANLVGGLSTDFLANGAIATIKGTERLAQKPVEIFKMAHKNGLISDTFIEYTSEGVTSKAGKAVGNVAMVGQKGAETLIRAKQIAGLLTSKEWKAVKSGELKLKENRIIEIIDNIERTQGHFSALHTAPIFRTGLGRAALPFTRWMFNSTGIMVRAAKDMGIGLKSGNIKQIAQGAAVYARAAMLVYGGNKLRDYASSSFTDDSRATKTADKAGQAMMEASLGAFQIIPTITDPATINDIRMAGNSYVVAKADLGLGDMPYDYDEAKKNRLRDIYYLGGLNKVVTKALGLEEQSVLAKYKEYSKLSENEKKIYLRDMQAQDKEEGINHMPTFKRYERYDKYGLTHKEFNFTFIKDKEMKAVRVKKYLDSIKPEKRKEVLERLIKARVIKKEDIK